MTRCGCIVHENNIESTARPHAIPAASETANVISISKASMATHVE
jgi:hypothetical protein